jgi:hypothetical protein
MTFEEEFDKFSKKWCGCYYAHLADTDENDGQELREYVEDNYISKQKVREAKQKIKDRITMASCKDNLSKEDMLIELQDDIDSIFKDLGL